MDARVFSCAFFLFFFFLAAHILIWRFRRPSRDAFFLFLLYGLTLALWFFIFRFFFSGLFWFDFFAAALLFTAFAFSYIQVYPASQADSPSFKILYLIRKSGPRGLSQKEIFAELGQERLFDDRLNDLNVAGLIQKEKGQLVITAKGRVLIAPFIQLREILGLPLGRG